MADRLRPILIALLTALVAVPALVLGAAPAAQADSQYYLYWSLWEEQPGGQWQFNESGAAALTPADGALNGWRFGIGGFAAPDVRAPRTTATFEQICGKDPAPAGQKKVAEVIDPGTSADAPSGVTPPQPLTACATVAQDANAVQALQAVAPVRYENGLVCGIEGYPATGCGDPAPAATAVPVDSPTEIASPQAQAAGIPSSSSSETSGPPPAVIAIAGLAAVVAVAAVFIARRRSGSSGDGS
ncbi:MAG: hypothetical protein E6Q90_07225 [Actinobacteria bacterium]|nr:MAG: hypothetical protein E6Q90_07225 [Actinomycetota bacterium]